MRRDFTSASVAKVLGQLQGRVEQPREDVWGTHVNTQPLYHLAVVLVGIDRTEVRTCVHRKTCTRVSLAVGETQKPSMKCRLSMKRSELLLTHNHADRSLGKSGVRMHSVGLHFYETLEQTYKHLH